MTTYKHPATDENTEMFAKLRAANKKTTAQEPVKNPDPIAESIERAKKDNEKKLEDFRRMQAEQKQIVDDRLKFFKTLYKNCDHNNYVNLWFENPYKVDEKGKKVVWPKFIQLKDIESQLEPLLQKTYNLDELNCWIAPALKAGNSKADQSTGGIAQIPCLWIDIDQRNGIDEETANKLLEIPTTNHQGLFWWWYTSILDIESTFEC